MGIPTYLPLSFEIVPSVPCRSCSIPMLFVDIMTFHRSQIYIFENTICVFDQEVKSHDFPSLSQKNTCCILLAKVISNLEIAIKYLEKL